MDFNVDIRRSTGALLLAGVLLVIAVGTALPAWRAGRTRIVGAIRPGGPVPRRGRARLAGFLLNTLIAQVLSNSVGGPPNIQIGVNWLGLALLIPATALVAALGAYVPARWAARIPAAEILRYE